MLSFHELVPSMLTLSLFTRRERTTASKRRNSSDQDVKLKYAFSNRTNKFSAIQFLRKNMPETPEKRKAVIEEYITGKSPTVKKIKEQMTDAQKTDISDTSILDNLHTFIAYTKDKRTHEVRHTMNILTASISDENLGNNKFKYRGLTLRRISGGKRIRTSVLKDEKSCLQITMRKTRSDAVSEADKKIAYEFWCSPNSSRRTGN